MCAMNLKSNENVASMRGVDFSAQKSNLILMGMIGKPKGVKGEVWIYTYTAQPKDIADYGALYDDAGRRISISIRQIKSPQVVATIDGVNDRDAAMLLRGVKLFTRRDQLPPLAAGQFYLADLIGMDAVDRDANPIGVVVDVANYGAGDIVEIKRQGQKELLCLRFAADHIIDVDLVNRRIKISIPDFIETREGEDMDHA